MVALRLECVDRNKRRRNCLAQDAKSHSAWSAWIEILTLWVMLTKNLSHSAWSAWIEMTGLDKIALRTMSHSAWSAWIEIQSYYAQIETGDRSHSAWSAWIEIKSR